MVAIPRAYTPFKGQYRALSTPFDQKQTSRGSNKVLFPWRVSPVHSTDQEPEEHGLWEKLKLDSRNYISSEIIRQLLSQPHFNTMSSKYGLNYMDPRGGEFLTGARQAFRVARNGIFAGNSTYKKVYTDDDKEHWDEVIRTEMSRASSNGPDGLKNAGGEGVRSNLDQLADIVHATIFGSSTAQKATEPYCRSPLSDITDTLERERTARGTESDTVSRGAAAPIEYDYEWYIGEGTPSANYAPSTLGAVMDRSLASFFEDASSRLKGKYTIHHTLHNVHVPTFERCEILFNAKRGYNFDLIKRHYICGVVGVAVLGDPPQRSASQKVSGSMGTAISAHTGSSSTTTTTKGRGPEYALRNNVMWSYAMADSRGGNGGSVRENHRQQPAFTLTSAEVSAWLDLPEVQLAKQELKKMKNAATIRVQVKLPCRETFFVTDNSTGLIVQGHCFPRKSQHNIVLEGAFCSDDDEFPTFSIVDIDNWLEGNNFV